MEAPKEWRRVAEFAVGGLREVGFTPDDRYLLVVSASGRGLIDTATGRRVARDTAEPRADSPWLDDAQHMAEAIGPATGMRIAVVGLWGGDLPQSTLDGWTVRVSREGQAETVVLLRRSTSERWVLDEPFTEVRAAGFSTTSRFLAIATSSDVTLFERATTPTTAFGTTWKTGQMKAVSVWDVDDRHVLSVDLAPLLRLAGQKALDSRWWCSDVDCAGRGAAKLRAIGLCPPTSGTDLLALAEDVDQVIDGEFIATRPPGNEPWLIIRAIDSTEYVVVTDDDDLVRLIRTKYRDVRDSPDDLKGL